VDVSATAIAQLKKVFDHVFVVDYVLQEFVSFRATENQHWKYDSWINESFTKWSCLLLTQYTRVCFVDADMVFMKSCEILFDREQTSTPSGCFSSPWSTPHTGIYGPFLKHNDVIDKKAIDHALYSETKVSPVCCASCVILEPSLNAYQQLLLMLRQRDYGYWCSSGLDEQALVDLYHRVLKQDWHHAHQSFQFIPWKQSWLQGEAFGVDRQPIPLEIRETWVTQDDVIKQAHVLHYFNVKPWVMLKEEKKKVDADYDDLKYWVKYQSS
jgi:alpha-N-acetylglucosamine transferase